MVSSNGRGARSLPEIGGEKPGSECCEKQWLEAMAGSSGWKQWLEAVARRLGKNRLGKMLKHQGDWPELRVSAIPILPAIVSAPIVAPWMQ